MKVKLLCIVIGLIALLSGTPLLASVNILVNPGFEAGSTNGWQPRGSCTISAVTGGRTGTYRAYVTNRSASWNGIRQSVLGQISNGQTVTMSGWVRLPYGTSSQTMRLTVEQQDGSGTSYVPVASATARSSQWTELSGQFTLNAAGTVTSLDIYFETASGTSNFYLDDAAVMVPNGGGNGDEAAATININTRHQTIEGFGAAGAWYEGWLVAHPQRNALYNILFNQLGLDIYRIRNTYDQGSEGTTYMSDTATIVSAAEATMSRPLKIMISSWSPPTYLKSNDSLVRGTLKRSGGQYMYNAFAQWWADSVAAWANLGVTADYISIQNEPDWVADWDTCRFDPTENQTNAGYNTAFDAVYNELYSRFGSSMPKMIAPETTGFNGSAGSSVHQYLQAINHHNRVYGYCHHLYNINAGDNPDNYLSAMANFWNNWGHKPLFQTEYEKSTDHWPDAMNMALLLHNSLVVEQVSSYIYWDLFWANGGLVTLDNPWDSNPGYTINSDYYGFKHYSAFIHSDWQRIAASSDIGNLRISAYVCPDNEQMTVVVINTSVANAYDLELTFGDVTLENGQVYRTTASQNCVLLGDFNPNEALTIPSESITTITMAIDEGGPTYPTTCAEVHTMGYALDGDLTANCYVDLTDVVRLAEFWLAGQTPHYNLSDFETLAQQWGLCNNPQDANCLENWLP